MISATEKALDHFYICPCYVSEYLLAVSLDVFVYYFN